MAKTKEQLEQDIKKFEGRINNPETPENIKKTFAIAKTRAEEELAGLEKSPKPAATPSDKPKNDDKKDAPKEKKTPAGAKKPAVKKLKKAGKFKKDNSVKETSSGKVGKISAIVDAETVTVKFDGEEDGREVKISTVAATKIRNKKPDSEPKKKEEKKPVAKKSVKKEKEKEEEKEERILVEHKGEIFDIAKCKDAIAYYNARDASDKQYQKKYKTRKPSDVASSQIDSTIANVAESIPQKTIDEKPDMVIKTLKEIKSEISHGFKKFEKLIGVTATNKIVTAFEHAMDEVVKEVEASKKSSK